MTDKRASIALDGVSYDINGASIAVIHQGRILIQFRPWPPGWELPGGHVDEHEDIAACAVRETKEECELDINVVGLVGVYSWSGLRRGGDAVYRGEIVSGTPHRSMEAWKVRFVHQDEMPRTLFPWLVQRIADAFSYRAGDPPVHRIQPVSIRHMLTFSTQWMRSAADKLNR